MTLINAIRAGTIPPAVVICARAEKMPAAELAADIAAGRTVIPRNRLRDFPPLAVGRGLRTKVNANIGTSSDHNDLAEELRKLETALTAGADSMMDLSTGGDLDAIRRTLIAKSPVMFGTVPIYQVWADVIHSGRDIHAITGDMLFDAIAEQARQGVDYMTVHCGVTRSSAAALQSRPRVAGVVSKGGALLIAWMKHHGRDNPLYAEFDRLLDIAAEYDVTLSLGDGLRPGAIADAGDPGQLAELRVLGELQQRALARGVQVMIEGPGHVPLHLIADQVRMEKEICHGAPFYVLGPLTCDCAAGYDHITAAIGGAIAAAAGADFLCYVTPAEHLRLPTIEDTRNGVLAARIAAHSGDIAKGVPGAAEYDRAFSKHRRDLNWEGMYAMALDPGLARQYRRESENFTKDRCTMCGDLCAIKLNSSK
ncbi:MAG: phosphomethylpyrimidine synthase ThiC [Planctomycetota bacterium]